VQKEITQLGLSYKLMTQFTSFVAVEQRVVTTNGKPQRVEVPVEMPEGVSYEGVFGGDNDKQFNRFSAYAALSTASAGMARLGVGPTGIGSGSGGGIGVAHSAPPPPPPPQKQELSNSHKKSLDEDVGFIVTDQERAAMSVPTAIPNAAQPSPTPDRKAITERGLLESKLSPAVLDLVDCWKKQQANCKSAPDGKIRIQLFLAGESPAVVDQLKALGLEIAQVREKERTIIGRLPLEKLTDLAKMQAVKFVTQVSR